MTSNSNTIIGAVIGDVIGSVFEWNNIKTTDFDLFNPACDFTDDSVLTIAVADCILNKKPFARNIWELLKLVAPKGELVLDRNDEIVQGCLICSNGEIYHNA